MRKYLLILLTLGLLLLSCGGKGGDARIRVVVWDTDFKQVWGGVLSITYNSKELHPKDFNYTVPIIEGMAVFNDMKIGNYCVTFKGSKDVGKCATQFRVSFEADRDIYLYEGQYKRQPDN